MRNIEFRAWLKDERLLFKIDKIDFKNKMIGFKYKNEHWLKKIDNNIEFMQYTGLRDKNGKKIFEGDIVRNNAKEKFVVEFDNEIYCFVATSINYGRLQYAMKQEFEVIGNIHDNIPESLEEI